jgi:HEAT repeat protein
MNDEELITSALNAPDDDVRWEFVRSLHWQATRGTFDLAVRLCTSANASERILGADLLGQLGTPTLPFQKESVPFLIEMLQTERDASVLNAVAVALGHLHGAIAIEPLADLKAHPDNGVRFGIVFGLLGYENDVAISALVELSRDTDADVRNWATFGLGTQVEADTPLIRDTLAERLDDSDKETRIEAITGLSIRHDERALPPLLAELSSEDVWLSAIDAAGELADPRLCAVLERLPSRSSEGDTEWQNAVSTALAACGCEIAAHEA